MNVIISLKNICGMCIIAILRICNNSLGITYERKISLFRHSSREIGIRNHDNAGFLDQIMEVPQLKMIVWQ